MIRTAPTQPHRIHARTRRTPLRDIPRPDARVRLDIHPTHASAVVAVVSGPDTAEVVTVLEADAWHTVADATLVLVRIDREEPHWAQRTTDRLAADGVTVDITPASRTPSMRNGPGRTTPSTGAPATRSGRSPTTPSRSTTPSATDACGSTPTPTTGTPPSRSAPTSPEKVSTSTAKTTCASRATPTAAGRTRRTRRSPTSTGSTATPYAPGPRPSPTPSAKRARPAPLCRPGLRAAQPDR
ncbi:hypothetical protein GTX14_10520 [Streptomyces sp. SID4944]|nr:hypothetical protein [Streptomyces sp. SID4944]